jgi:hypothetical protein
MTTTIEKLTDLLRRLNGGENTEQIKQEAQQFLAKISPEDLTFAEQKLVEAGLKPEDLRHLCSAHMVALGDNLRQTKANLSVGHVLHTMYQEHDRILSFLDQLETLNQEVQQQENYAQIDLQKLEHIADHLLGAEPHHQREEQVLFPALEDRGVFGPPQVMRMEHEDLRNRKRTLKKLALSSQEIDFKLFQKQLDTVAKLLIMTLRDHIFKENNILYPTALQVISDPEVWQQMKQECDLIGYCCFTPEV